MRLELVDWNNDGVMDLLLGNLNGTVSYYEGYRFGFTAVTAQGEGQYALQWNSTLYLTYHVFAGTSVNSVTNLLVTNWPAGGNVTTWTNYSSESRQFYRVQVAP